MEQLNNLDVAFLVIVGISALVSIARGVTKELLSITGWILAGVSVYCLLPVIEPIMLKYIASEVLANLVAGMVILVLFCVFWVLAVDKITMQIRLSKLSALDRILGFIFGIARGVLIVILVEIMITSIIPEEAKKGIFAESRYFQLADEASGPIKSVIPEGWIDELKDKTLSLGLDKGKAEQKDDKKAENNKKAEDNKNAETDNSAKKEDKAKEDKKSAKEEETKVDNSEILKQSGEELFNKLVQPKTESEAKADTLGYKEGMEKDLDKLMDILDDTIVSTEDEKEEQSTEDKK